MRFLAALPFCLFAACTFALSPRPAAAQGGPATIVTAEVLQRPITDRQVFIANITPHRRATIGSAVDGRVLEYPIDAGEPVEAEQALTQLRPNTMKIEVAAAKAELDLREAEVRELENGSRPEEIALAEAQLAAARASADYAAARFQRSQRLYQEAAGLSQDEFEANRAEAMRTTALMAEAENQLELARQGPRKERVDQARARLAMQEQMVQLLEDRLRKYTIRSPFDGIVSQELTEQGAWISQGDPVAEVVELNPVDVEVFVPESSIQFVVIGGECEVTVEAFPGQPFTGTIDRIVPVADPRSRSFPVRVIVPNERVDGRHRLLPGMLARVSLATGDTQEDALLVPKDALLHRGSATTVVKVIDGTAVHVPVRIGVAVGGLMQVTPMEFGALGEADTVVVRGNERLRPGQAVKVISTLDSESMFESDEPMFGPESMPESESAGE